MAAPNRQAGAPDRLLAGPVAKIQILLLVGTIASDLMMRFTALVGARRAAVPSWHISSAGITIIPIIEMLDGVGRVGPITGGLGRQGNGTIATGRKSQ